MNAPPARRVETDLRPRRSESPSEAEAKGQTVADPAQFNEQWLARMCQEAASMPVVELAWEPVREHLFGPDGEFVEEKATQKARVKAASRRRWYAYVVAGGLSAAAAGAVLWGVSSLSRHELRGQTVAVASAQMQGIAARAAAIETHDTVLRAPYDVVARDEARVFRNEQWASVRVEKDSHLTVHRAGSQVELELRHGVVHARVNKLEPLQAFVVWSGSLAVRVRGTEFSVARDRDDVRVHVRQGQVEVLPRAEVQHGSPGSRWLVDASRTGVFSVEKAALMRLDASHGDGMPLGDSAAAGSEIVAKSGSSVMSTSAAPTSQGAAAGAAHDSSASGAATTAARAVGAGLTLQLAQATLNTISDRVRECHRAHVVPGQEGLRLRASTHLTIRVAPDGHVEWARFDPPLIPAAQTCASAVVKEALFPRTPAGGTIVHTIDV